MQKARQEGQEGVLQVPPKANESGSHGSKLPQAGGVLVQWGRRQEARSTGSTRCSGTSRWTRRSEPGRWSSGLGRWQEAGAASQGRAGTVSLCLSKQGHQGQDPEIPGGSMEEVKQWVWGTQEGCQVLQGNPSSQAALVSEELSYHAGWQGTGRDTNFSSSSSYHQFIVTTTTVVTAANRC